MQHYIETNYEAKICVCTSKSCQDRGSDATMATFTFLAPEVLFNIEVLCLICRDHVAICRTFLFVGSIAWDCAIKVLM